MTREQMTKEVLRLVNAADQQAGIDGATIRSSLHITPDQEPRLRGIIGGLCKNMAIRPLPGTKPRRYVASTPLQIAALEQQRRLKRRQWAIKCARDLRARVADEYAAWQAANVPPGGTVTALVRRALGSETLLPHQLYQRLGMSTDCGKARIWPVVRAAIKGGQITRTPLPGGSGLRLVPEVVQRVEAREARLAADRQQRAVDAAERARKRAETAKAKAEAKRKAEEARAEAARKRQQRALEREQQKAQARGAQLRKYVQASLRQATANAAKPAEAPAETVEQFLARGGQIQVLPHNFDAPRPLPGRRPGLPSNF